MGVDFVRLKIATFAGGNTGPHSMVGGLACGDIRLGALDDWLAEKMAEQERERSKAHADVLLWAKIAAWAAIVGIIVAVVLSFKK